MNHPFMDQFHAVVGNYAVEKFKIKLDTDTYEK